jgi:hypothetical protein
MIPPTASWYDWNLKSRWWRRRLPSFDRSGQVIPSRSAAKPPDNQPARVYPRNSLPTAYECQGIRASRKSAFNELTAGFDVIAGEHTDRVSRNLLIHNLLWLDNAINVLGAPSSEGARNSLMALSAFDQLLGSKFARLITRQDAQQVSEGN